MAGDARTKSGEYNPQVELMRALAVEAADAAVTRVLSNRSEEDGASRAQLTSLMASVGEMRTDLKQALAQQAKHDYQIGSHSEQLRTITAAQSKEREDRHDKVEAIAKAAAQAVLQQEVVERAKVKRSAWDTMLPSIIGSVLAATITAAVMVLLSPKGASSSSNPPSTTAHTPSTGTPP